MSNSIRAVHLVCNAHLDPVWLWRRNEGICEALSTFRIAADFCDEYDNFVFCHNEAVLYQWIEEYDPRLFRRIRKLIAAGRWHIMGGWFLQPDCNMISGESAIRQIEIGRKYFHEKFGVKPETAVNFDPFGHSRGLVQVLKKCGYKSYLFMRPDQEVCKLPEEIFRWLGYDGSEVVGHRLFGCYLTNEGKACLKLQEFLESDQPHKTGAVTWGIGNHGGGPSRIDLEQLNAFISEHPELAISHSNPDAFFKELAEQGDTLPVYDRELNFFGTGCYTSQVRIKQQHNRLESDLNLTEKMAAAAWLTAGFKYPETQLLTAAKDLAFSEFHDILPGSSIKEVEDDSLRQLAHGREILSLVRTGAFIAMLKGQPQAENGDMPVFVYNPHPYLLKTVIDRELQPSDQNFGETFTEIDIYNNGRKVTSQIEREASNLNLDWRKRIVFEAELPPGSVSRFECRPRIVKMSERPDKPVITGNSYTYDNGAMAVTINRRNGLLDSFKVDGKQLIRPGAGKVLAIRDNDDSWGTKTRSYRSRLGSFKLMKRSEIKQISGFPGANLAPVSIIESGPVRTVVEAVFAYSRSIMRVRYVLPAKGAGFEVKLRIDNMEPRVMLKMSWPFIDKEAECLAQDIFGCKQIPATGEEKVFSKWFAATGAEQALAVICDSGHGLDFFKGEMRYSLLRSPCYSALPIGTRPLIREDRIYDRMDIGQREFNFKVMGGRSDTIMPEMDRETALFSERPETLLFYPGGHGEKNENSSFATLSGGTVVMTRCHRSADEKSLILRIFNPVVSSSRTKLSILDGRCSKQLKFGAYEFKTFRYDPAENTLEEVETIQ